MEAAKAIEKLDGYTMRWKIETFHRNLKAGRPYLRTRHPELAHVLADNDQAMRAASSSKGSIHFDRNGIARVRSPLVHSFRLPRKHRHSCET
jgi:hypothetical protein